MDIKVDKDIPVPNNEDTWKARLNALEVEESFSFPEDKRNSVRQNVSGYFHRLTHKRFTVSTKNQESKTARVWRIR